MLPGYDVRKAAQVAAFFALRDGGSINVLKLSKLLYLAEREFMRCHDAPMFYDNLVSMPDGPVVSITLNLINGELEDAQWSQFVLPRETYNIQSKPGLSLAELDELSRADLAVLNDLWKQFGHHNQYSLRDWTHNKNNIPEWTDPQGSSLPIDHEEVFSHLGKEQSKELVNEIKDRRNLVRRLNSAR